MDFSFLVAWRYLRAKRSGSVSVIAAIAVLGIALGVGALSAVLAVTSGFEAAFREKVLGVNAHLLVLKHGWNFTEYRDVIRRVRETPGVLGAAPFLINPMMITRGDRIAGVLVKGVDPALLGQVLDLPTYLVEGSIAQLRRADAQPPGPADGDDDNGDATLDDWIRRNRIDVHRHAPAIEREERDGSLVDGSSELLRRPTDRGVRSAAQRWQLPNATADRDATPGSERPLASGATPAYAPPPDLPADNDPLEQISAEIRAEAEARARHHASELPGVIVGRTLAHNLELHLGDPVRIISPLSGADAALVRHGSTPRTRDFRVTGIFEAGFDEYDSKLVYVDLWEAQRFFDQGEAVTGVEVKVRDIENATRIGRRIERELGGSPFHTLDWESLNHNLFTALRLQKLALSIVITIIIVVAAFNVIATLVMVVLDKRREIAILKAMGADESVILRVFMLLGLAIGGVGTLLGLALGVGICVALERLHFPLDPQVYLISQVPVRASPLEFVVTAVVAFAVTLAASALPAQWAALLAPIDGLRHE